MALKQANTLAPSNVSATGFAITDARYIGGHRSVASLTELYALHDWQLRHPEETDTELALGQQWYVKGVGFYRLTNWAKRKSSLGWTKVIDPNNIDTTLFQIVSALPTSGINKNRIYILATENRDPNGKNIYAEYIYTGDTSATYDETKWEKLGEYTTTVDLSPYSQHVANKKNPHGVTKEQVGLGNVTNEAQIPLSQKGVANGVATLDANGKVTDGQLWDATSEKHGLMSKTDKITLDALNGEISFENLDLTSDKISEFIHKGLPTRLKVTTTNKLAREKVTVGTLDIFTDWGGHQLTEIFISNYGGPWDSFITDFESFDGSHIDGSVFACHRSYNNIGSVETMGIEQGTWSKWRGGTDDFTKKYLDTISEQLVTTGHKATDNELPLQKDNNGKGFVTIEVMSNEEIDALFT